MIGTPSQAQDLALIILVMRSSSQALTVAAKVTELGSIPQALMAALKTIVLGSCASTDDGGAYSGKLLICMATRQHKIDTGLALASKGYNCIEFVFSSTDCGMNNHGCIAALRITDSGIENDCI